MILLFLIRRTKIKTTDNTKCCWGSKATRTQHPKQWWQCTGRRLPYKLNTYLSTDPAIPLLCILENLKLMFIHKYMFTAELSLITPNWKQSKCSSVNEWINNSWCIYTMETTEQEKEQTIDTHNLGKFQHQYAACETALSKYHTLYDSIYKTFAKRQNCSDRQISICKD